LRKQDYSNVIYMNGGEQLRSILIHIMRLSIARVSVEEMLMNKKLTLAAAGLCGSLLALAPMLEPSRLRWRQSAKPLPKTIFVRRLITTGITIAIIVTGITIAIIVTVGGATAIATAAGGESY